MVLCFMDALHQVFQSIKRSSTLYITGINHDTLVISNHVVQICVSFRQSLEENIQYANKQHSSSPEPQLQWDWAGFVDTVAQNPG